MATVNLYSIAGPFPLPILTPVTGGSAVQILFLGHAGLFIESRYGSILCDPWFNPAYYAGWWPFPANDQIPAERLAHPDYLYISHLHQDHFDARFLQATVDKSTTVLLPAFPVPALEDALRGLGFSEFIRLADGALHTLPSGLKAAIWALDAPSDGPLGDSCLFVDDGETRIFNMNDARPRDLDSIKRLGPLDGLFLQFSGAIWYPFAYDLPPETLKTLGQAKRKNEMARARAFIEALNPKYVFPSAGPPTFLDASLFPWNDFDNDPANPFPDQTVFLEELRLHGTDGGQLVLPGSEVIFESDDLSVHHHLGDETLDSIFKDKRGYLERYQKRMAPVLEREQQSWPEPPSDLFAQVRDRLEPIMALADVTARQIGGTVVLEWEGGSACLDFRRRKVVPWDGQPARYYFRLHGPTLTLAIQQGEVDWVNSLFLSFRFRARREGEYNEAVYTFFKCQTPERIQYAEGYWLESHAEEELFETHGYLVQRRCPHLKADLQRFGVVDENQVLTCQMHGWQFDLKSGRCLNANDRQLYRRLPSSDDSGR